MQPARRAHAHARPGRGAAASGHRCSLRLALPTAGGLVLGGMAVPAAAAAAGGAGSSRQLPARVQHVLEHLASHPLSVSSQTMQYDPEPTVPLPECVRGLSPADVLPSEAGASGGAAEHWGRVIAGLLYGACGGLDEAHNLVTPLCWGSWTAYAGSPIANSPAAAEASYVHAIVHRQEGLAIGEFGSGFSNANYWYRAAGPLPIFPQLLEEARGLAAGKPACEAHVAKHGASWRPSAFVGLCEQVASARPGQLEELRDFASGCMAAELRLLLDHCYSRLG